MSFKAWNPCRLGHKMVESKAFEIRVCIFEYHATRENTRQAFRKSAQKGTLLSGATHGQLLL